MSSIYPVLEAHLNAKSAPARMVFWIHVIKNDFDLSRAEFLLSNQRMSFEQVLEGVLKSQEIKHLTIGMTNLSARLSFLTGTPQSNKLLADFTALSDVQRVQQYATYQQKLHGSNNELVRNQLETLFNTSHPKVLNTFFLIQYYINAAMDFSFSPLEQKDFITMVARTLATAVKEKVYVDFPASKADPALMKELATVFNELGFIKFSSIVSEYAPFAFITPIADCNVRNKYMLLVQLHTDVNDKKWNYLKTVFGGSKEIPTEITNLRTVLGNINSELKQNQNLLNQIFNNANAILSAERGFLTHTGDTLPLFDQYKPLFMQVLAQPLYEVSASNTNGNRR